MVPSSPNSHGSVCILFCTPCSSTKKEVTTKKQASTLFDELDDDDDDLFGGLGDSPVKATKAKPAAKKTGGKSSLFDDDESDGDLPASPGAGASANLVDELLAGADDAAGKYIYFRSHPRVDPPPPPPTTRTHARTQAARTLSRPLTCDRG